MSGIKAHTLRIWEQRYKILKPERTDTNIRYYNDADLRRILNISVLNHNGHKISSIAGLSDIAIMQHVKKYLDDYSEERNKIESLYIALLDMDEGRFEEIINNSIYNFGFENTIEKVAFPFLKHLGNMWQVGAISPAQEHYISNLIRQKLIVGLNQPAPDKSPAGKVFLFFLPESELHEMGLLYTSYLAKTRGHTCVYLGQSVPLEDLINMAGKVTPDYLVSIFTSRTREDEPEAFLKGCEKGLPEARFLVSGRLLLDPREKIRIPGGRFSIFEDFMDFKKWL